MVEDGGGAIGAAKAWATGFSYVERGRYLSNCGVRREMQRALRERGEGGGERRGTAEYWKEDAYLC